MHEIELNNIEQRLNYRAMVQGRPFIGCLELLPLCNMNCDMCYVRMSREECEGLGGLRTVEQWLALGEEIAKAGVLTLLLTGGEPLIYPGFRELYLGLRRLGLILSVNTNATLLDEEWADFFGEYKPRQINITLYGADDRAYETLCHHPGGYEKTVRAIRMLRERDVDVRMNITVTPANRPDLTRLLDLAAELDIPAVVDTYMQPIHRDREEAFDDSARMSPEEAARAQFARNQYGVPEEEFLEYALGALKNVDTCSPREELRHITCNAGRTSFVIDWQGHMRPCLVMNGPLVDVFARGFLPAWEELREGCRALCVNDRCVSCRLRPLCRTCVANAACETGRGDGIPTYLCRWTEEYYRLLQDYVAAHTSHD